MVDNDKKVFPVRVENTPNGRQTLRKIWTFLSQTTKKRESFLLHRLRIRAQVREILKMPSAQLSIAKRQLDIREAWQIGENDPDVVALYQDDEPIIPAGVTDPPVNKALIRKRSDRQKRNRRDS